MQRFTDRVVVVTGGGGGIGGATCHRFAQEGAQVAVLDMNPEAAQRIADSIVSPGGQATEFTCDITRRDQLAAAVHAVAARRPGERRGGEGCVSTCCSRWLPSH